MRAGDRSALAQAISVVEAEGERWRERAELFLSRFFPLDVRGLIVGITGVPGAGKSTFIEALGLKLCAAGKRLAVLAIDPSSPVTGGSILGDRTRMGRLALEPNAFIRPSPSGGTLGGVARRTREVSLLCLAAEFDVVLVETVGVGQSEAAIAELVDCVVAIALPGAGDELQGVKRGLLEVVDVIAVNKADGAGREAARIAAGELIAALRLSRPSAPVAVLTCSASVGEGVGEVWSAVEECVAERRGSGVFAQRRAASRESWLASEVSEHLARAMHGSVAARSAIERLRREVAHGAILPGIAASQVIDAWLDELCAARRSR